LLAGPGRRIIELLVMWRWANYMKVSEMKGFPSSLSELIDQNFTLGRQTPRLNFE
jgi:hypothetical protein